MNNNKKQNTNIFITFLTAFAICLLIVFFILSYVTSEIRIKQNEYHTQKLCELIQPCELQITITYDTEPINVILHTPSGKQYSTHNFDKYEDTGEQLIISVITEDLGEWCIEYVQKRNKTITINTDFLSVNQLFLTDLNTQITTNDIEISFLPLYGDGTNTSQQFRCIILMDSASAKKSVVIYDDNLKTNEPIIIHGDITNLITSNDWELKITTYKSNDKSFETYYEKSNISFTKY